jgi:hypothetical protein
MKPLLLAGLAFLSYGILIAQDPKVINDKNAQKRSVSGYHGVLVSHGIDLYLTQGNTETVAVSASKVEHRDMIKTTVEGGILKIFIDKKDAERGLFDRSNLRAYVSFKMIDKLEASGGSDVQVEGTIKVPKLNCEISGGSDFKGRVDIADLNIDQSGGSDVDISGKVGKLKIEASGGSDFEGYQCVADYADINASGASDVNITVNKELTVEASGGSDVHYKGNAVIKNVNTSGGSGVSKTGRP